MQSEGPPNRQGAIATPEHAPYEIILPCAAEDFGEFISGLLGKPQTIERLVEGAFELSKRNVSDAFHLVDQRIHQQNEATLVQFSVRVMYDDDSSVLLNSLTDFEIYNEIRPLKSIGAVLSWSYLVKFRNKTVPEKQTIDLTFGAAFSGASIFDDGFVARRIFHFPYVGAHLRIQHTDRTWGVDLESLLTGFTKTLARQQQKVKDFIRRHSTPIGWLTGTGLFLSAIAGSYVTFSSFTTSHGAAVRKLLTSKQDGQTSPAQKLDFLVDLVASGAWPRFIFASIAFLLGMAVLSLLLGLWVSDKADKPPRSFVLFTRAAEEDQQKYLRRLHRDWALFWLSIAISIVTGIVSNILFSRYFGTLT